MQSSHPAALNTRTTTSFPCPAVRYMSGAVFPRSIWRRERTRSSIDSNLPVKSVLKKWRRRTIPCLRFVPPSVEMSTLEADHQKYVVNYLRSRADRPPFTAPCNGAISSQRERTKAWSMGMQLGVPDLLIFVGRRGYFGLAIEMKSKKGAVQANQITFHDSMRLENWCVRICRSAQQAINVIEWYLNEEVVEEDGVQSV